MKITKLSKLLILSLLAGLNLAGCNELEGELTLQRPIYVIDKKGQATVLPSGNIPAKLSYQADKRRVEVALKDTVANREIKIHFLIPDDVEMPGSFQLRGEDIGQAFDLNGNLQTLSQASKTLRASESCTYYVREYTCRGRGSSGRYHSRCGYYDIPHRGMRDVEYHSTSTTVSFNADLLQPFSLKTLGTLAVLRELSHKKTYDRVGSCRR